MGVSLVLVFALLETLAPSQVQAAAAPELDRDMKASPALQLNWTIVKDWSEAVRYDTSITAAQARDLYSACTARRTGILPSIRTRS